VTIDVNKTTQYLPPKNQQSFILPSIVIMHLHIFAKPSQWVLSPVGKLTLTPTFQHPFKTPEDSTEPKLVTN
jgi:hypothetical protein